MIEIKRGTAHIDFAKLRALYIAAGFKNLLRVCAEDEQLRLAFENTYRVITAYSNGQLVGAGRLISDGVRYGMIFDLAVFPRFQGRGIGRAIVDALTEGTETFSVYLQSAKGKEGFYEKLRFLPVTNAYARIPYPNPYTVEIASEQEVERSPPVP